MNLVSPDFLARSRVAFRTNQPPTLAELRSRVEADTTLDKTERRDLLSALNRVPAWFGRPLAAIPATPTALRELFAGASAAKLNLATKTLANVRSLVVQVVTRYGPPRTAVTRKIPPDPIWRGLIDRIVVPHHRHALGRLAAYGSVMKIPPKAVETTTLLGLHHALIAEELVKDPRSIIKNTISSWNRCRRLVEDWPNVILESPFKRPPVTLPLSTFPASFQEDVTRWQAKVTDEHSLDDDAPVEPLAATTVDLRVVQFRAFASAVVHSGQLQLEEVTGLSTLFTPARFTAGLRWFLERPHNDDSWRLYHMANALVRTARYHCKLDEEIRGKRAINESEAEIVRRIFHEFASGRSPKVIAHALNQERIPAPAGRAWGPSTIYGNWRRGTGILNNELYIGRLVWNRQRFIKDPQTSKRQAIMNPTSEWIVEEVPHLRIIDDELWERVKHRQEKTRSRIVKDVGNIRSEKARRPRYLLSGLIKCGDCGGGFSMNGANRYACSTARNKGICSNRLSIRRDDLEARVLDGLRKELMHPDLVKEFIDEFHREVNRLAAERDRDRECLLRNLEKTTRELKRIVQAIKDGVPALALKDELMDLESRKLELEQMVSKAPAPIPRLHPSLADLYRRKVDDLHDALNREHTRAEAAEAIRALIDEIRLVPEGGELKIELFGELAALVGLANKDPRSDDRGLQVTLVAGARKQRESLILPVRS